jgi:hypothetical protein
MTASDRGNGPKEMKLFIRTLLVAAVVALGQAAVCYGAQTIRVASQKTGTFAWELAVIRAHGLDKQADLSIEVIELASPEAGKIVLRAGKANIIISDWLWVSRERAVGAKLKFYPLCLSEIKLARTDDEVRREMAQAKCDQRYVLFAATARPC